MKKTNKSNPLKTFNDNKAMAYKKAGGAMKVFKKSLKKAQDGINMNDDLINKAGSTGGYKKESFKKYMPWGPKVELIEPSNDWLRQPTDVLNPTRVNQVQVESFKKQFPNGVPGPTSIKKNKKGGSIK